MNISTEHENSLGPVLLLLLCYHIYRYICLHKYVCALGGCTLHERWFHNKTIAMAAYFISQNSFLIYKFYIINGMAIYTCMYVCSYVHHTHLTHAYIPTYTV